MDITTSSAEPVERAMVDPEALALKRSRSLSPAGEEGRTALVVVQKRAPRPGRQPRKRAEGQRPLLLLPAPPSSGTEVSNARPCMPTSPPQSFGGSGEASSTSDDVLVNVPVAAGEYGVAGEAEEGGSGSKFWGRRTLAPVSAKAGAGGGGPIRREKGKRAGVTGRDGVHAREKKKKNGGGPVELKGGRDCGGQEVGTMERARASPSRSATGGAKGKLKTTGCCWGAEADPEGPALISGTGGDATPNRERGRARSGGGNGSPLKDLSEGQGTGRSAGKGPCSPSSQPTSIRTGSNSPAVKLGSLCKGRLSPGGRKGGKEAAAGHGHAELVRRIKGAVFYAEGGEAASASQGPGGKGEGETGNL